MTGSPNILDASVNAWVVAHQWPPAVSFFLGITTVGSVNPVMWFGIAGAAVLAACGRWRSGGALLIAPLGAQVAHTQLKSVFARARPVGLHNVIEDTYSFPSAHATMSAAVCCTLAYIVWREGLLPAPAAITFSILVPLLIGASRVYLGAHWTTDVLGGWVIGAAIAVFAGVVNDRARPVAA
jgi:undecaprenyl-diphosphatase